MSKAAKIAITIGLMVVWALLRSLLEYSDFPLPVLTFVFIIIILGIWAFGKSPKTPEEGKPQVRENTVNTSVSRKSIPSSVKDTDHSLLSKQENPEKQSDEKLSIGKPVAEIEIKPSIMKGIPYEQQLLELLRKACFPRNYMEPYDPDRVSIANDLYNKLQAQDLSPEDIYSLRDRAVKELGITIDASFLFEELSTVCNPTNYMDPYDPEKVEIANGLYRRALENKSNIIALEEIREDAIGKGLLIKTNEGVDDSNLITNTEVDAPSVIVGFWKSVCGEYYRLAKYDKSELVGFEKLNQDLWVLEASLVLIHGNLYSCFGTEYYDYDSPKTTYRVKVWNGDLIQEFDGVVSKKLKIVPAGEEWRKLYRIDHNH